MQTYSLGENSCRANRVRHLRTGDDRIVHPGKRPFPAGKETADAMAAFTIRAAFQFGELVRTSRSSSQLHALPCDLCAGAVQCCSDDPNAEAGAGGDAVTVPDLYWRRVRGGPCFPPLVDRKEPGPKLNSMSSCSHANMAVNAMTLSYCRHDFRRSNHAMVVIGDRREDVRKRTLSLAG